MEPLHVSLPPLPTSVPLARRIVGSWLEGADATVPIKDDALVVVSELVTNGVMHAPDANIQLDADVDSSSASLEMTIDVTTRLPPVASLVPDTTQDPDERGRGLRIVASLVDQMTVTDEKLRHSVRCRLQLSGSR